MISTTMKIAALLLLSISHTTQVLAQAPGNCTGASAPLTQDIDFFGLFTQQESSFTGLREAPRIPGMDPLRPAFEFSGVGRTYSDDGLARTLSNIACSTNEITIYASLLFKRNDMGGPVVVLSHTTEVESSVPLVGLYADLRTSQLILVYSHMGMIRAERFTMKLPRGRWVRVAVTLSGTLVVVHMNCEEVHRRVVLLPDYCTPSHSIMASVGDQPFPSEYSSNGFTGSMQNCGLWFGKNGISKQCPNASVAAICPTCGQFLATINKVFELRERVVNLTVRVTELEKSNKSCPTLEPCGPPVAHSCLIDDSTQSDKSFVKNRAGEICFCDNGNARCVDPNGVPSTPPEEGLVVLPPINSRLQEPSATTSSLTCRFQSGTIVVPVDSARLLPNPSNTRECINYTCVLRFGTFASGRKVSHQCDSRLGVCNRSLSAQEQAVSVCCGTCNACDFAECGEHSTCTPQQGMDFNCRCNSGFEQSGGRCVDRNECELGIQIGGHNCPANSQCHNTEGSFECRCQSGHVMNEDGMCVDQDECSGNLHNCDTSAHEMCVNQDPGFRCDCKSGYQRINGICQPVCSPGCANGGQCIAPGQCRCLRGFRGNNCQEDINECTENLNNCSHVVASCVNTHGGYFCRCNQGFQHVGDQCSDINECETGLDNCIPSAKCINTFGSFTCVCENSDCTGMCSLNGQRIHNHQSRDIGCDTCTCQDGDLTCVPMACDCSDRKVDSTCCPHCANKQCRVNDMVLDIGMEVADANDPCVTYRCVEDGSRARLERRSKICLSLLGCERQHQYVPAGACCPVCMLPRCTAQNNQTTITLGNGCDEYQCMYYNSADTEWVHSRTTMCPPMMNCPSNQIVFMRNKCCPVCEQAIFGGLTCSAT